ncbi:MAG: hypothetical protein KC549_09160, partial [Myxococcales bacterium]|nr:hypothetical protein [Myxococcales bacterium]
MRTLVTCLALVGFQAAWAQDFEKTCLMEGDAGNGLSLVVDGRGDIHLSRIFRVLGELNYTRIDREGVAANEELASFVSLLGVDEADNTDLLLEGDAPRICYYNAGLPGFEVALLEADGWHRELIQAGVGAGRWCTLLRQGGNLITVFGSDDGILRSARRVRRDDWVIEEIDRVADLAVGREASAALIEGRIVVAHRTGRNQLRVSWQGPDGYAHQTLQDVALGAGVSPVAVNSGGEQLWVVHGIVSPPGTSDGGLVLAQGTRGALRSQLVDMAEVGGAIGAAALGRRLTVVTRYYRRNAIFGSADGLRFYENLTQLAQAERLEEHGSAFQRHVYGPIQVAADPFGMPVIAALDEAEPFG